MSKNKKTNAMRILEALNIEYDTLSYEVDLNNLDAIHASKSAGLDPECVFKTIVMVSSKKEVFVFCLPAEFNVSLKKARALTGTKDIELIKLDDLQKTTGYIRGGCSPLGMKKQFPTFISELAQLEEYIFVSAGVRGEQLKIKPDDLIKASNGIYADFI